MQPPDCHCAIRVEQKFKRFDMQSIADGVNHLAIIISFAVEEHRHFGFRPIKSPDQFCLVDAQCAHPLHKKPVGAQGFRHVPNIETFIIRVVTESVNFFA